VRIGIIGAGHIGGTLTRRLSVLGHEVTVANSRGPHTLAALAQETGAAAGTVAEAARGGDVVVVSIPERSVPTLPGDLFSGTPPEVTVIDTNNYYPGRDGRIEEIEDGTPSSVWVGRELGRPVVKAFNTINYSHLMDGGRPSGSPSRRALPVAGDETAAKQTVMGLVDELGFDPVDAGTLGESWRQEPGTPVYGADLDADGVRRELAAATPAGQEQTRAER
jgi:predicted dinucleotide-binding enzyme